MTCLNKQPGIVKELIDPYILRRQSHNYFNGFNKFITITGFQVFVQIISAGIYNMLRRRPLRKPCRGQWGVRARMLFRKVYSPPVS